MSNEVSRYDEMCRVLKRNMPKSLLNNACFLQKIVGAWLLSHLLPQKLLDAWGIYRISLLEQSVLAF